MIMTQLKKEEIPEGYKQTEIGVIPEDWALVTYDEAFKFLRTASYSRDQLGMGTTIYIHYGDVHTKWNHFVDLNEDLPTIEDEKVNNYSLIEDGDLVVADASEDYEGICKSVEVRNKNSMKAISGLHTFLLRDKGNYFADGFKGYIHCNSLVKASMDKLATGLKVYGVSKSNLKLIKIPQPPLPEQNAIISVLSDMDRLITKQEKLIRKKKSIKQGAMQELLTGNRRLPDFSDKWVTNRLGNIFRVTRGQVLAMTKTTEYIMGESQYPVYSSQTKSNGLAGYYKDYLFQDCITWTTDGANAGDVKYRAGKFYCTNVCGVLESKEGYSNPCIAAIFNSI